MCKHRPATIRCGRAVGMVASDFSLNYDGNEAGAALWLGSDFGQGQLEGERMLTGRICEDP